MGNQITAIAPAQILPLESYFSDLTDFSKPIRLASGSLPDNLGPGCQMAKNYGNLLADIATTVLTSTI